MAASDPLWPPATPFDLGAFADLLKGPVAREPAQPPFPDPLTVINRAPEPLSRAYMDDYAPPLALDAGAFLGRNEQMTYLYQGAVIATLIGVNLNATGDNIVPIQLPTGFTRFTIQAAYLSNPSITPITTAMVGLYRFASQVDPIAAQQAVNLTNINPNAPGNMMELTLSNPGALALSQGNIPPYVSVLFNVGTAQGAAATADLTLIIVPIP